MKFKTHSCPWCKSEEYKVILQSPDRLFDLPGRFQFVECTNCGLVRQNPYLDWESLKTYYPSDFTSFHPLTSEIPSTLHRIDKRYGLWKRIKLIEKYKPNGTWLDIGAGTGRILHEASLYGKWELMGIEPVSHAAKYIEDKLNITVFTERLEDFTDHDERFDIVTMWDVLEHLEEPIKGLQKVHKILRSKGIFAFSTPNMNAWEKTVFQDYWIGYELPRHLFLFPEKVLSVILNDIGFKIISKNCIAGSHSTLMLDLKILNKTVDSKFLNKFQEMGDDAFIPRMITFIPLWILDQFRLGTNITYLVQKL